MELLGALILFMAFRAHALLGDGAVYALTIHRSRFFERSIHVAYYAAGWVAVRALRPFGLGLDDALVVLNAGLTTAALGAAWVLFRALGVPVRTASIAVFVLLFSGNILIQGTSVEVYALELVLVLASYVLFLRGRNTVAGLAYGAALLVTPLAAFGAGFFLWEASRHKRWKDFLLLTVVAAAVLGFTLAFCWREYFFGVRGLATTAPRRDFGHATLLYNAFALAKNFHWLLPFGLLGLWRAARARDGLAGLALLTFAFHAPALLGMREDGVFALLAYPVVTLLIAGGLLAALEALAKPLGWIAVGGAVTLYVATAGVLWLDAPSDAYRDSLVRLLRTSPRGTVILASWGQFGALELYAQLVRADGVEVLCVDLLSREDLRRVLRTHREVLAIEKYYPNRLARWAPASVAKARYDAHALVPLLQRALPSARIITVRAPAGGPTVCRVIADDSVPIVGRRSQPAGANTAPARPPGNAGDHALPSRAVATRAVALR